MSEPAAPKLVANRGCEGCAMCCKLFDVKPLGKAAGVWCQNCGPDLQCAIYDSRPDQCRAFWCHYMLDADVPEYWKPSQSHMVLVATEDGVCIVAHVEPKRPDAWRKAPYYRDLKKWSLNRIQAGKQVHVRIGARTIVVLPDRDEDLGDVRDRAMLTTRIQTPQGPSLAIQIVAPDDPRVPRPAATPNVFRRP